MLSRQDSLTIRGDGDDYRLLLRKLLCDFEKEQKRLNSTSSLDSTESAAMTAKRLTRNLSGIRPEVQLF